MVDWMTLVRDYFRQQISTVMVAANGTSTSWQMGQWMDTSNYTSFQSDWERWGSLMTADGQLISLHSQTGNATTMLNAIAAWSVMDIFANTNTTYSSWSWINGTGRDPGFWNYNIRNMVWTDIDCGSTTGSDRFFEHTTTGIPNYRWILYY